MKAPLGAWLVLSSSRRAQAGSAALCSLGGRQGSAKAEGPQSSHPTYPSPVALHAQPLPGLPLLDLSQPVLLCHHLLPLSLQVACEGPHDVALLVSMGLWGQDRNLSWGSPNLPSPDHAQHRPPHCRSLPLPGLNFPICKMGTKWVSLHELMSVIWSIKQYWVLTRHLRNVTSYSTSMH